MPKHISACSTLPPAPIPRKVYARASRTRKKERFGRRRNFSTSSKPSMAYLVKITPRAERALARLYEEINAGFSDAALKWYRGLKEAILSLEEKPNRCPITAENKKFRHLLYGNKPHIYPAIYRVLEKQKQVEILHIRHGARWRFKGSDDA